MDILQRLRAVSDTSAQRLAGSDILDAAAAEIERLREAKRRALNIADERSKENVELRRVRDSLLDALRSIAKDGSSNVEASVFAANVARHYDNVEITADRT